MAEKSSDSARFLCSICLEDFTDPKLLPCFHTYCLLCLESYVERVKINNNFDCPLCRVSTAIPVGGVGKFQANFYIPLTPRTDVAELLCDVCDKTTEKKAEHKCLDCDEYLCEHCFLCHTKMKVSREHKLVSLTSSVSDTHGKIQASYYCKRHPKEEVKMACIDCEEALCIVCKLTNHENHNTKDVRDMAIETRKELTDLTIKVDNNLKQTSSDIDAIHEKMEHAKKLRASNLDKVEQQAELYILKIKENKGKLIQEIESKHKSVLNELEACVKDLELLQTNNSQLSQLAKCIEETADDATVVSIGVQFKQRSKENDSMKPDVAKMMNIPQFTFTSRRIPNVVLGSLELQKESRKIEKCHVSEELEVADAFKENLLKMFPDHQTFLKEWLIKRRWPQCEPRKCGKGITLETVGIVSSDFAVVFQSEISGLQNLVSSLNLTTLADMFMCFHHWNVKSYLQEINDLLNWRIAKTSCRKFKIKLLVFISAYAISIYKNQLTN